MNFTQDDLFRLAKEDPRYIIESGFWVVNKEKETVPFIFNNLQNDFYDHRTTRDDVVKASQIGYSTEIDAILAVKFLLVPNSCSVIISHEAEATRKLKEKVDFFLDHLPDWLSPFLKLKINSTTELENEITHTKLYIGTAGAIAFGRGQTIHYAHLSEVAWWKDQGRVATGIIRAVPLNDPNTWIVKESTANGEGTWHHTEWKREKAGQSEFSPYFAPWFKYENYVLPEARIDKETYDEEEKKLLRRYPEFITPQRLAWRRMMVRTLASNKGRTPEEMFRQEFPSDDKEAFLFSGNPFFPVEAVEYYQEHVKKPITVGNLYGLEPDISFEETDNGYIKFWDFPYVGGQFEIGADVGKDHDFCSATVVDKKTWKVVAKFRGRISPYEFGTQLNRLGRYFNDAQIIPEANNQGISTIDRLLTLNYPHIYKRKRLDKIKNKEVEDWGWWTSNKSKPKLLDYFHDIVRTAEVEIPDEEIIEEMRTYSNLPDGSLGASEGNFDDQVISSALAYYGVKLSPFRAKITKHKTTVSKVQKFKQFRSGIRRVQPWRGR